jgi:uncharacterized membrane protein YkoI
MQVRNVIIGFAAVAVAGGIAVKSYAADEPVSLSQTPAAVQTAIKAQAGDGKIGKIVKGVDGGITVFEAVITKGGKDAEISFDTDGKVVGSEEVVTLKDVPKAARKTIKEQAGSAEIKSIEKAVEGDKVAYEALINKDGKEVEIVVAADGTLQTKAGAKAKEKDEKD